MTDAEGNVIADEKHLLSLKDLNRSGQLEALLDAGVSSFKIEGRLKDVAYVKNITAYYRKQLDAILARRPEYKRASSGQSTFTFEPVPEKSFNRGFTSFFLNRRTPDITSFDTPKSTGEWIGTVKEIKGNSFTLAGTTPLNNGDGLAFFNEKGELEGFRVNKVDDNRIFPLNMPSLPPKTAIYRNYDQTFDALLSKPSAERKIAVEMTFHDSPTGFTLCITDETAAEAIITEPFSKEPAEREQSDNIRKQLSRLGNTIFKARKITVSMEDNWFVPSSLLADMRRRGIEWLMAVRKIRYCRETARKADNVLPYPEQRLTYLGNVSNSRAEAFYKIHGVKETEPAFELSPRKDVPLMFTKHCLRYSMGWCPVYQKQLSPYKEPYYLLYKDTRLRLQFDCKACRMLVFNDNQ
jgi:putative protease